MSKSRIFLYFCLSFIGGIFLSSTIFVSALGFSLGSRVYLLLPGLILGILLISILWQYKKIVVIGFCLLFLAAGIWRHQQAELKIINNEFKKYNDIEQEIILTGIVSEEPDIRSNNIKLTIELEQIKGNVLVTVNRYPEYNYGDRLEITGKLKTPHVFDPKSLRATGSPATEGGVGEDFNYKDYLAKDGIYSVMYFPEITRPGLIDETGSRKNYAGLTSGVYTKILGFKNKLRESIYKNLPPPQSSILGAIILGDKRKMSEDLKEKLNVTGVRHITAISGMHVGILTIALMSLLIGLGFWRKHAFYLTIILIALFVVMTGLQSSAIRAGIMGGLFLLAQYLGRQKSALNAIVLAAAVMLMINPLLLKLDVGFQLSFLAILGIIYLSPIFRDWIHKWFILPNPASKFRAGLGKQEEIPNIFNFKDVLAMTLAAQVFTLPILVYNFGYISLVSPITNLLIVPILPYIMGLGFVFGILGVIFQPMGWILSWPSWLLLTYLTKIVDFFSWIPLAHLSIGNLHWAWLIISYLILGYVAWKLNKKQKLKFLNY